MNEISLEFRIAESRLLHLETEMDPLLATHEEANLCPECEKGIRYGIDEAVQDWLARNEYYEQSKVARDERFAEEPW